MRSEMTDGKSRRDIGNATGTAEALVEAAPLPAARPRNVARLPGIGSDRAAAYILALQRGHGNAAVAGMLVQREPTQTDDPGAKPSTAVHRATSDNLRPLIENRLETWKRAAETGVENFADAELLNELEDATSFNVAAFLTALAGNIIWAAACFNPAGAVAFTISMSGIAIATAAASGPKAPSKLMQVKTGMQHQLDGLHANLKRQVARVTDAILAGDPDADIEAALEVFMRDNFERRFLEAGGTGHLTEFAEEAVRETYQRQAAAALTEVAPIGESVWVGVHESEWRLVEIGPGNLAIAAEIGGGWVFKTWVGAGTKEQALKAEQDKGRDVPIVDPDDVANMP